MRAVVRAPHRQQHDALLERVLEDEGDGDGSTLAGVVGLDAVDVLGRLGGGLEAAESVESTSAAAHFQCSGSESHAWPPWSASAVMRFFEPSLANSDCLISEL